MKKHYEQIVFLYILLFVISLLFMFITNKFLNIEELTYHYLTDKLQENQVKESLNFQKKYKWVGYVIIPIILLVKITLVSLCLSLGKFFTSIEKKYKFKEYFRIALLAEFVFLLVGVIKLGYFLGVKTNYTLEDIQYFFPFSAINLFDYKEVEPWLIYPLQTVNVFEVIYWFILAYGIMKLVQIKFGKAFELVLMSYGVGLIIWVGFVTFLTLNIS